MLKYLKHAALAATAALCAAPLAQAAEQPQEWELVNPAGVIEKVAGDVVLDRLAELLSKKYPSAKVVKVYRDMADQNVSKISATQAESMRISKAVASVRPDIVIASQAD